MKAIYPFQRKEKKVVKTYLPPSCGRGDARRAGGWPKVKESKANLRRYGRLLSEEGGRYENTASPYRHFERKRDIFFVRDW